MKFNYIETSNIKDDFLKHHNLDIDKYNDFNFIIDETAINNFYNKIIENKNNKFLIVGDYDCDGICATTIIKNLFICLNIEHSYYIPSRIKEGYGLNKLIIDKAIKHNYNCLILVDNGVSCKDEIDYAYENNIKVFIIDHHNFKEKPRCESFLHQNLLSSEFEYASAGELCFLLSLKYNFNDFNLVLGALTILSDYIIINSFNRFLVKKMLEFLNQNEYVSFNLLNGSDVYTSTSVSFNIIPKINSVSRMESQSFNANHVVKFLLNMYDNLSVISNEIDSLNKKRKKDTTYIFNEIIKEKFDTNYVLIASKDINEGYCSSLATKLSNYYDKPVFVFSICDGICKGSGRGQNIDIYELIKDYDKYISFGGHHHAVGLNINEKDLEDFKSFLNNLDFSNRNENIVDVYLFNPNNVDNNLFVDIESLGPFGNGYEAPLIGFINNNFNCRVLKNKYLKFFINDKLSCICFDENYVGYNPKYIIGSLNKDTYNVGALSLIIKYLE